MAGVKSVEQSFRYTRTTLVKPGVALTRSAFWVPFACPAFMCVRDCDITLVIYYVQNEFLS